MTNVASSGHMFSVLCFLAWSAFELGYAEDTCATEVISTVLYSDHLKHMIQKYTGYPFHEK